MRLYEMQHCSPQLYLMAVLIVAIKIWYRLDGSPTAAADGMPASPDWVTWAQSAFDKLQGPVYPPADQEVLACTLHVSSAYAAYVQTMLCLLVLESVSVVQVAKAFARRTWLAEAYGALEVFQFVDLMNTLHV